MHSAILELNNAIGGNKNVAVYGYSDTLMAAAFLGVNLDQIGFTSVSGEICAIVDFDQYAALSEKLACNGDQVVGVTISGKEMITRFRIGDQRYALSVDSDKRNVDELRGFTNAPDSVEFSWANNIYRPTHLQRLVVAYNQYVAEIGSAKVLALFMAYAIREFNAVGFVKIMASYLDNVAGNHQPNADREVNRAVHKLIDLVKVFSSSFNTDEKGIGQMIKYLREVHPHAVEV